MLHRVLYRGVFRFECLLKQVELLLYVLSQVLPVELWNGIQFHDDRRLSVLERLRRVNFPSGALELRHIEGTVALDLPLRLHLVQDAALKERFAGDLGLGLVLVAKELLPDPVARQASLLVEQGGYPEVRAAHHVLLLREEVERLAALGY